MSELIVISGGTQGIGLALVEHFYQAGFVVATCARRGSVLAEMRTRMPGRLHTFVADVAERDQVQAFGAFVLGLKLPLAMLINNAGVFMPGHIGTEAEGVLERQLAVNVQSAYHLTRTLLPTFKAQQKGHIFNMCSTASITPYINGGSYCISKFALLGFSKVLREELKKEKIRVTAILPGAVLTPSWDGVDLPASRFIDVQGLARLVHHLYTAPEGTVVEEILVRPQDGDI